MRLHLIRHGQTQSNVDRLLDTAYPGAPLTDVGQQQAQDLVAAIEHEPLDALYSSTYTRAQQTAAPLAKARGLDVQVLNGVHEISAGVDEMSPDWTNYVAELNSWSPTNMDSKLVDGESAREFIERYTAAVQSVEAAGGHNVAIVSHGAAIRVWSITQQPDIDPRVARELHNTEWVTFEGSGATGWTIERWGPNLIAELSTE